MTDADLHLAEAFADLARTLLAETDMERTLARICERAVETVDGCEHAGITLVRGRELSTPGSSDGIPRRVGAIQFEVGQGPCLDSIRQEETVEAVDLADDDRWPDFAPRCVDETGVRSMLALRLFAEEDTFGALTLYSRQPAAFGEEERAIGAVLAAHAAVAVRGQREKEQMTEAIGSRDVIGQAKGLLMAREGVSSDEAFDMLRNASQRLNVKLREVAQHMVDRNQPD